MKNTALISGDEKPASKSRCKKKQTRNIFIKILKSPVTALIKVSNMYMNSMSSCAYKLDQTSVVSFNFGPQLGVAPARSFAVSPNRQDDLNELIRAVSKKLSGDRAEQQGAGAPEMMRPGLGSEKRSYSIGIGTIGRIDEDAPCEFKEALHANVKRDFRLH